MSLSRHIQRIMDEMGEDSQLNATETGPLPGDEVFSELSTVSEGSYSTPLYSFKALL